MSDNNLLERARALAGSTAFVALPLAAVAPAANAVTLLTDYSVVGEYSNSGWFMSWLDDAAADATPLGNGFKLTGSKTITDSLFWRWDDNVQATVRRYDVTGMAFAWGGAIDGGLRPGDAISAPFDLILDYTHTLPQFAAYDYYGVNWHLTVGLRADGDSPYTPDFYRTLPTSNSVSYADAYGSVDQPGQFGFSGNLNISIDDWSASQATHWYAVLTVDWNDALAQRGYEDTHGSHNGDTLTFTVPGDSIDLTVTQGKTTFAGETIESNGGFTVPSWSILRTAGTFRNLSGATLRIEGTAETAEGGVLENLLGGTIQNAGTFRSMFGGVFGSAGSFDNLSGAVVENSGTMKNLLGGVFGGAGSVTNHSDGVFENAGLLSLLGGSSFSNWGKVDNLAGARIENDGTFHNVFGGLLGNAGSFDNRSGASFENSGTFSNLLGGVFGGAGSVTNHYEGVFENAGLVSVLGGASFSNSGQVNNLAGARIENSGTLYNMFGGVFGNAGTLTNALGGQLFNYGQFTNSSNHTVNNDGYFYTDGPLENTSTGVFNNNGTVEIGYSGSLMNDGEFNNEGAIVNSGYVYVGPAGQITGTGTYEQGAGYTLVDGTLSASQIALHGGYLAGAGVVTATGALTLDGDLTIYPGGGDIVGVLTIEGDFAPAATTGLMIDIDGPDQATQYDLLAIAGSADLAGNLYLDFGYTPVAGTVFTILTATGGVQGQFANIFAGGLQVAPIYGTDRVSIQFGAPVPEPGTYAMFLAGLGLLGLWSKRRR